MSPGTKLGSSGLLGNLAGPRLDGALSPYCHGIKCEAAMSSPMKQRAQNVLDPEALHNKGQVAGSHGVLGVDAKS